MEKANPFLSLPAELRIRIYEAHYEDERDVDVPALYYGDSGHGDFGLWHNRQPPITKVNRQLRDESLPVFYSFCTFHLDRICSLCIPDGIVPTALTGKLARETCRCIPDGCYRRDQGKNCRLHYWSGSETWHWVAAIGEQNLAHIREIHFRLEGLLDLRHGGFHVTVYQQALTKELSISAEKSFWQGEFDPEDRYSSRRPSILGTDPRGQAIIEEILQALKEDENVSKESSPGLTAVRIYKILDVSYRASFGDIDIDRVLSIFERQQCQTDRQAARDAARRRLLATSHQSNTPSTS